MIMSYATAFVVLASGTALAEPTTFAIDPDHTYPSFEADHMGGMSVWRGKFRTSSGTITLDQSAHTGQVAVTIDAASVEFGHEKMNERARSAAMFDVERFPTATYQGRLVNFRGDVPTAVEGVFTMHGISKPLRLTIRSFKCRVSSISQKLTCGADAMAHFNRAEFGIDWGKSLGFNMDVQLAIEVEAIQMMSKDDPP
jgi:polyisoprenoid-binding protein YceI